MKELNKVHMKATGNVDKRTSKTRVTLPILLDLKRMRVETWRNKCHDKDKWKNILCKTTCRVHYCVEL